MDPVNEPTTITVTKIGYTIPVSCCVLGTCDGHEAPRLPWRRRVRWQLAAWWADNRPHVHRGPCDHTDCW